MRDAISRAGLLAPDLNPHARREAILRIVTGQGISEATVRRQMKAMQAGAPMRKRRSDAGQGRALSDEARRALYAMLSQEKYANNTVKQLHDNLLALFPDDCAHDERKGVTYSAVRAEKARYEAALPKAVSTPRRIEIAGANTRWEMDLSKADMFIADKRLNDGFPFRPQLIVCEDACTRCLMFAAYMTTGRAVDVGAVLHQAILPQSDIWPQCGLPREVGCDWGKVFVGEYFPTTCAALGITVNPGHPYYPQDKGKCERLIGTIHHSFENALVGWCTSNNKGDDSIDPRKHFRQIGAQWIDPRFDRALFTLPEINALLQDWIGGSYHRAKHSTLGCSPNDQWLAEMRGKQIQIPERQYLEQAFLPWERRQVRRGQVTMHGLPFQHEALAQVEGCTVQVRYLPDDISKAFVYYDGTRVCEVHPSPTFVVNSEGMDWKTFGEMRSANRERQDLRRRVLAECQNADIKLVQTQDIIHANAADADPMFIQPPTERKMDPMTAGLTDQQIADLRDLQVWGMPVIAPQPVPDFDEAEEVVRKLAYA